MFRSKLPAVNRSNPLQSRLMLMALVLGVPALSLATPVTGELDLGGSSATAGTLFINFNCNPGITLAPCPAPANFGNFTTTGGTGSFAPYNGQGGYIQDLGIGTTPINQAFTLNNFLIFSSAAGNPVASPDIALNLTFLFPGIDGQAQCLAAPAAGQLCTPSFAGLVTAANPLGLSTFNLQNTQTGSTASFSVAGTAKRISTGEISAFTGIFTAQFDVPYQTVLANLASNGSVTNSYSATFAATVVPEPVTMSLMGIGLIGLALLGHRRRVVK